MLKINYKLGVFDMDTKKIGIAIIVVGLSLCVMFIDSYKYLVSALTVDYFRISYNINRIFGGC